MKKGFKKDELLSIFKRIKRDNDLGKLSRIIDSAEKSDQLNLLQEKWPEISGLLAEHTYIARIRNNKLIIQSDHGIFSQQLQYQTKGIIDKITEITGLSFSGIEIITGNIAWKGRKTKDIMSQKQNMVPEKQSNINSELIDTLISKIKDI